MKQWGLPPDTAAWAALVVGGVGLALAWRGRHRFFDVIERPPTAWFVATAALFSALLSALYVRFYLGGGPRIIDATSYLLQARLFAEGKLAFAPPGPLASFHSRFLHVTPDGLLTPIFPPGYPALLAVAIALGSPMALGPVLAAALTTVTYCLGKVALRNEGQARLACAMSAMCAVLRYHTADTMSHGWSAVLLCGVLALALAGRQSPRAVVWYPLLAGLCAGWLFATRPLTGLVACGAYAICTGPTQWLRAAATTSLGAFAFLWHQQRLTGRWGGLVQHGYYDTADGPVGCVRLGFGEGIGCRVEHGDFMQRYMPNGYGPWEALGTTSRRLAMHLTDAGNVELFFPLLLVALVLGLRHTRTRVLALTIAAQVVAYAVFYFDGNYPGGGARMFAELVPLEHVLLAWAAARLRLGAFVLPVMLTGFGLHTSYAHRHLAEREGGRPMYEAERIAEDVGMVFVDTDHGFNIGHDPGRTRPVVVRHRGDGYDLAAWLAAGQPKAVDYEFDPETAHPPAIRPSRVARSWRFEAESNWPARRVEGGWIEPRFSTDPCVSAGRQLRLHATPGQVPEMLAEVWVPEAGRYRVLLGGDPSLSLEMPAQSHIRLQNAADDACGARQSGPLPLQRGSNWLVVQGADGSHFDYLELELAPTPTF